MQSKNIKITYKSWIVETLLFTMRLQTSEVVLQTLRKRGRAKIPPLILAFTAHPIVVQDAAFQTLTPSFHELVNKASLYLP
jgi:hypothetical protein